MVSSGKRDLILWKVDLNWYLVLKFNIGAGGFEFISSCWICQNFIHDVIIFYYLIIWFHKTQEISWPARNYTLLKKDSAVN